MLHLMVLLSILKKQKTLIKIIQIPPIFSVCPDATTLPTGVRHRIRCAFLSCVMPGPGRPTKRTAKAAALLPQGREGGDKADRKGSQLCFLSSSLEYISAISPCVPQILPAAN